jgi:hypothetical protein
MSVNKPKVYYFPFKFIVKLSEFRYITCNKVQIVYLKKPTYLLQE